MRDGGDRLDVGRDVLAGAAVATGGRPVQSTVAVDQGQRDADGAQGAAQCDLSTDRPAYLYTFDDNDQRDTFIDSGGVIDCTFIFGSGVSFDYVVADGVIIRPEDNEDAQAIADAVDGEVRTLSCEVPDQG